MNATTDRPAIEEYGLIGDTRTAALAAADGSIDWMCLPRFDGQPVFGRLVGGAGAGHFTLGPAHPAAVVSRRYRRDTATLETTWDCRGGRLTLSEGMIAEVTGTLLPSTLLVRRLTVTSGPVEALVDFDPRLGERHRSPRIEHRGDVLVCSWGGTALAVTCTNELTIEAGEAGSIMVTAARPLTIAVAVSERGPLAYIGAAAAYNALEADERRWQEWAGTIDVDVSYAELVRRSALTLRLLTYSPSGAPVAAPTTSLPEEPGGIRNWDYRFAWPRDASIGVGAFLGLDKTNEARRFMAWLLHASRLQRPRLPAILTIFGRHVFAERELVDWPGYRNSRPVRIGNGAADQHQLDGYGWVLDAAWLLVSAGHRLYSETWRAMRGFTDEVAFRWREPDAGIWEERGESTHHVHSKLMAWLALDRALRIADTHPTSERQTSRWQHERDAVAIDVATHGYNSELGSYVRAYGTTDLDAAVLVLPLLDIEPPGSPRVRSTINAIARGLRASGPLIYRYPPGRDGLAGGEGAFLPCSFWLVQALAMTGRHQEAHQLFDQLAALASPLGLYAEEMDPSTGHHLGNYPQALTHAALLQAALALRHT